MTEKLLLPGLLFLTFFLTLLTQPASAQRWTVSKSVQTQIDDVFGFINRDEAGCALGIVEKSKLSYGRGYGLANLDWGIPITTSTVFDIGSVSKQFTASAMALLEIDGVLSLQDDIRKWVPEIPDYGHTITIRHLLNHTSGIRDYLVLEDLAGTDFANVYNEFDGMAMIVRQQGLNFEPGSEYLYSNSGYLLLANIVRKATGESLRSFLEQRVFDPLGMSHSSVWDDNTEVLAERATGYSPGAKGWMIEHAWNFQMGGDGQVITSVDDLVRWDANFYRPTVGGNSFLEKMHTQGILNNGETIDYALGISVDEYRGLRRVQHGGAWAGFRAMLSRFPEHNTSVIVLCNRGDATPSRYANQVADALLSDIFPKAGDPDGGADDKKPSPSLSTEQLERWSGLYREPERASYVAFEVKDGQLYLSFAGQQLPLHPRSESEFEVLAYGIPLQFSELEGRRHLKAMDRNYHDVVPEREASPKWLTGDFYSSELDVTWTLSEEESELTLKRPGHEPEKLEPGIRSEHRAGNMALTVERQDDRRPGFRVFAGRVTDIGFQRKEN